MADQTLRANGELIKRLCATHKPKKLTLNELSRRSGWPPRSLSNLLSGKRVSEEMIRNVAEVLGVPFEALIAGCNPDAHLVQPTLDQQQKIMTVIEASRISKDIASILGTDKVVIVVYGASVVSLLLACMGLFPINAKPLYVAGLVTGLLALGAACLRRQGFVLPIAGVVACSSALSFWPNVVGFFPTPDGHRFGIGTRATESGYPMAGLHVLIKGQLYENEPTIIRFEQSSRVIRQWATFKHATFTYDLFNRASVVVGVPCEVTLVVGERVVDRKVVTLDASAPQFETTIELTSPPHPPSDKAYFLVDVRGVCDPLVGELPPFDVFVDGHNLAPLGNDNPYFATTPGKHSFSITYKGVTYRQERIVRKVNDRTLGPAPNVIIFELPESPPVHN